MSNEGGSQADRDLLARLNALKKTHIDLDDKQYRIPVTAHVQAPLDPSPAKALHGDLLDRFKSLNGTAKQAQDENKNAQTEDDDPLAEEDSKTIEELLAELGGEGAWNIEKDEATQIDDLLRSANTALKDASVNENKEQNENNDHRPGNTFDHDLPSIDITISNPTTNLNDDNHASDNDEEDDQPRKSKADLEADLDREADDMIAKLKDQLKNAPPDPDSSDEDNTTPPGKPQSTSTLPSAPWDLPDTPSKDPEPPPQDKTDIDLASRFASLSLPTTLPSAPSSKPTKFGATSKYEGHTNDEIDSWCVICLEDATLRCLGCDGDLYCPKCWVEGHRGPDAGYEERKHKAVEYRRAGKKEGRRKVAA